MKTKVTQLGQQSGPISGQNRKQGEVLDLPDDEAHSLHAAGLVEIQKPSRLDLLKVADQEATEVSNAHKSTDTKTDDAVDVVNPTAIIESDRVQTPANPVADDTTKVVTTKKKN